MPTKLNTYIRMAMTNNRLSSEPSEPNSARVVLALDNALSMFDESIKKTIYFHLKQKGVLIEAGSADPLEIERGLRDVMAGGAEIILAVMRKEMERIINLQ